MDKARASMVAFSSEDILLSFQVRCKSEYAVASSSAVCSNGVTSSDVINFVAISAAPLSLSFLRCVYSAATAAAADPMEAPIAAAAPPPGVGCFTARLSRNWSICSVLKLVIVDV